MTSEQHRLIERGYQDGLAVEDIAKSAGCSVQEVETFLTAWCSQGAPGAFE